MDLNLALPVYTNQLEIPTDKTVRASNHYPTRTMGPQLNVITDLFASLRLFFRDVVMQKEVLFSIFK